jgi:hypothetical protein
MDCEKVRDRFSSLWEKELAISEEKIVREHLSSCPECQREFERFEKTMGWLRSVGEVEVPEGFLPELYKKMEERKRAPLGEKAEGRWFGFPLSFKLPVQAFAMVAIVFLVLYLTKMMPMDVDRLRDTRQPSVTLSEEEKSEQVLSQKEMEKERKGVSISPETPRPKDIEVAQAPVPREEKFEGTNVPPIKAEAKKAEPPPSKTEIMAYQQIESKEVARAKATPLEPGKIEKGLAAKEKLVVASKPPKEIIFKISNRAEVIPKLQELIKQFRGEIVTTEENIFLASLPTASLSRFEEELAELSTPPQADKVIAKRHVVGGLKAAPEMRREEADERSKEPATLATDQESRTVVRILLIQE